MPPPLVPQNAVIAINVQDPVHGLTQIAITIRVLHRNQHGIPIVDIACDMLPGVVSDPEILFGVAIRRTYDEALRQYNLQRNPVTDMVQFTLESEALNHTHNNYWASDRVLVVNALDDALQKWEESIQSGGDMDLSDSTIQFRFQYTLNTPNIQPRHRVRGITRIRLGRVDHRVRTGRVDRRVRQRDLSKKMWNHICVEDLFFQKYLFMIPIREVGHCFIMAFLVSQCRTYIYHESNLIHIEETQPKQNGNDCHNDKGYIYLNDLPTALIPFMKQHLPFLINDQNQFILFNPYKPEGKVNSWETNEQLQILDFLAIFILDYVQRHYTATIDEEDLLSVGQAFATVFQMYIHIHRLECQSVEIECFHGSNQPLDKERHLHIMLQYQEDETDHCHGILDVRDLIRPYTTKCQVSPSGYCEYCHLVKTSNNCTVEEGLKHIMKCRYSF